jgi:hypothetical protein
MRTKPADSGLELIVAGLINLIVSPGNLKVIQLRTAYPTIIFRAYRKINRETFG